MKERGSYKPQDQSERDVADPLVRRAFQPLAVVLAHEEGKVRVFVVNDRGDWHDAGVGRALIRLLPRKT